jgi:hypothetical protein
LQHAFQVLLGGFAKCNFGAVRFVVCVGGFKRLFRLALREQSRPGLGGFVLGVQLVIPRLAAAIGFEILAVLSMFIRVLGFAPLKKPSH